MKSTILCALLSLFIFNSANAADFRKSNWGATTKQIIKAEGKKPNMDSKGAIYYKTTLNGIEAGAIYILRNNRLTQGIYMLKADGVDGLKLLREYKDIDKLLEKKYGKAERLDNWARTKYQGSPSKYGTELRLGYLTKNTIFRTEKNTIFHTIAKDRGKIKHQIIYESSKRIEAEKKKTETRTLNAL